MDNTHIKCTHKIKGVKCGCFPKYLLDYYNVTSVKSYKDVPGWINDAEDIYAEMVEKAQDGDQFVEIGVFLGQSACRMGELIKDSGKKIKFDAIDIYWSIIPYLDFYRTSGHPYQFYQYIQDLNRYFGPWVGNNIYNIIKHPMLQIGIDSYVNLVTCDERYSHRLYDDNSLQFVWIDGDHTGDTVLWDLKTYWPKIKKGGYIGGDDTAYEDVAKSLETFIKEFNIKERHIRLDGNSFLIRKI